MPIVKTHRLSKHVLDLLQLPIATSYYKNIKDAKKNKPEKEKSMFALMYASEQITKINEHKARVPV